MVALGARGAAGQGTVTAGPLGVATAALLPGVPQLVEGRRWTGVVFAAVEVGAWWIFIDARHSRQRERTAYRDLAWSLARGRVEPRLDPGFEYYEDLLYWTRSGRFDVDPGGDGVQPERDPSTYNGRQWELAAGIFLGGRLDASPGDPGWDAALAYYLERAWSEPYTWDWGDDAEAQREFARRIDRADAAARRASIAAGVVVGNHLLSAVEAFVAHRLESDVPVRLRLGTDARGAPLFYITLPIRNNR